MGCCITPRIAAACSSLIVVVCFVVVSVLMSRLDLHLVELLSVGVWEHVAVDVF